MSSEAGVPTCLVCKGGVSFLTSVVLAVIHIEAAGGRFSLLDNDRFRVDPGDVLTDIDRDFLRAHRDEVRRVLDYYHNEGWLQ